MDWKFWNRGDVAQARDAPGKNKRKKITIEDVSHDAVNKAVMKEATTSGFTLLPLAGSAGSVIFTLIAGPTEVGLIAAFGLAFVGAASWVVQYCFQGEARGAAYANRMREQRRQQRMTELDDIGHECLQVGFADGAKTATELKEAYQNLRKYFDERDDMSLHDFKALSEDTFGQGVATLTAALEKFKAVQSIDKNKLGRELLGYRRDLERLGEENARAPAIKGQIEDHEKRLDQIKERSEQIDQLLGRVTEIESALQTTYLGLVDLGHDQDPSLLLNEGGGASERLTTAMEAARRVEARLRGNDSEMAAKESRYSRAADEANR